MNNTHDEKYFGVASFLVEDKTSWNEKDLDM
jgi:hypothetical protein